MWEAFTYLLARIMTVLWFAGAILMILTIPACAFKIFSALWEPDDAEEKQAVTEKISEV